MPEPLVQRLPETTRAVQNKYTENPDLFSEVDTPIKNALLQLDIQRAGRGQNPLSVRQTQLAIQAAQTGQAATRPPEGNFFENIVQDIRTLTTSIPRLPAALINEVRQLPQAPAAISEAMASGNFQEMVSGIASAPGVRLLPGSYIAQHALTDPGELAAHPVFTLLDVLPAKEIPGVKQGIAKGKQIAQPVTQPAINALKATRPGQLVQETFGATARDVAQVEAELTDRIRHEIDPTGTKFGNQPLVQVARRASSLRQKYPHIAEERRAELTRMMQEDADSLRTLPAEELAFVNEVRDITDQLGKVGVSEGLLTRIDGELYDPKTASGILRARRKATIGRDFANIRNRILTPIDDPVLLRNEALQIIDRQDLKPGGKLHMVEGYIHALEAAGYDASPLYQSLRNFRGKNAKNYTDDAVRIAIGSYTPVLRTTGDLDAVLPTLTKIARTDPMVARTLDAIKKERWSEARQLAKRLATRKTHSIPDIDTIIDRAQINKQRQGWLKSTKAYDESKVVKAEARAERIFRKEPPARFKPVVERQIQEHLTQQLSTNPRFDEILPYLRERNYGWLKREGLISQSEFRTLQTELNSTWVDLKRAGYDPVFVHRLSPSQLPTLEFPRVLEVVRTPTQVRRRSNDVSPYIEDVSIALNHQALEWLAKRGSEEFVDQILNRWGRSEADLIDQYLPAARQRASRKPQLDVLGHANELMRQEWVQYNPFNDTGGAALITWPAPRIKRWGEEDVWLPKTVANTIQRMHSPPTGRLSAIFDPVMKVFRTSLLPLSPRWHVYNIIGGGILLTARTDPRVWRFAKQAVHMVRNDAMPEHAVHGLGSMPREIIEWNAKAGLEDKLGAVFHYQGGRTMRRLWEETKGVRDAAGNLIQKSYDFNGFVDDMYRTMSYLYGYDKAVTRGLSKEAAEKAGVELSRKVLQNWDRMTPIERTIMRYVFPFYGWMNHIIKYSLSYPIDHPFRTAVMGSFARNELEDMGDALPERFLNMFFLGDMDMTGNVKALNMAGMNPFSDVANYFTLSGFMGQTNPILSSLMESMGVDPTNGGPELFPNLRYDPEIGRLKADTPNPVMGFIQATIPQSRILMGFADRSSEFQELLRTNPESAGRLLISQAGLPILFRQVNIPQEIAKAEISRDEAQSTALNEALRSGNWSQAESFPNLRPILDQLRTLQGTGALDAFQPQSEGQSKIGLAQEALARTLIP